MLPRAKKPRILVFSDYFVPGYKGGGSITSLRNLVDKLSDEFCFSIVTRDRDYGEIEAFRNVVSGAWTDHAGYRVLYTAPKNMTFYSVYSLIRQIKPDFIYLNSFLSRRFALYPLIACRGMGVASPSVVIAPRGEFSAGALSLKPARKYFYKLCVKTFGLLDRVLFQASSEFEAADIRNALGSGVHVRVAPDLPAVPPDAFPRSKKRGGSAVVAFLGRISPMKNLEGALRILSGVGGDVTFALYGPVGDREYWDQCKRVSSTLPASVRIEERGALTPDGVAAVLSQADLLFMPSLGENYGHAVVEAMGAGCPVLVSDRTPWKDLETLGVGWSVPLFNEAAFMRVVQKVVDMDEIEHSSMRNKARMYAHALSRAPEIHVASRQLFGSLRSS